MENAHLQAFIDRLVGLHKERKELGEMIGEVKNEARSAGFDIDGLSEIVRRVLMTEDKVNKAKQREEIARVYAESIGQSSLF